MEGIINDLCERGRWRNVVCNSSNWDGRSSTLGSLPLSKETNQDIGRSTVVKKLRDKVKVGHQSGLKDDGHVGSIEKLNGVSSSLSTVLLVLDRKIHTPSLEVNDNDKDEYGSEKVCQVRKVLTVECLLESPKLITTSDHQVEKSNDSSLEFSSTSSVEGSGRESLPDNSLANVGSNEKRDTRSKTISLLKQFIKSQDNKSRNEKLYDNENGITSSKSSKISIHSRNNVCNSLTDCDEDTEKFLSSVEKCSIFLDVVVYFNDSGSSKKLHDKSGSDNGRNSKFHESSTVRCENDAHPVERIRGLCGLNSIDWDLTAYQEDKEGDGSPQKLLTEWNLTIRTSDLWEDAHYWADQMKESHLGKFDLLGIVTIATAQEDGGASEGRQQQN
mmetsp:Transcript_20549/g.30317  ORF Transcript_20549/g.30317 Transcript_20549/m.30317 type:complete len:387 (-) Transcript_20549:18-1178(-)